MFHLSICSTVCSVFPTVCSTSVSLRVLPGHAVAERLEGVVAVHHGVHRVVHADEPAAGHDEVGEAVEEQRGGDVSATACVRQKGENGETREG